MKVARESDECQQYRTKCSKYTGERFGGGFHWCVFLIKFTTVTKELFTKKHPENEKNEEKPNFETGPRTVLNTRFFGMFLGPNTSSRRVWCEACLV